MASFVIVGSFLVAGMDNGRSARLMAAAARIVLDPLAAFDSRSPGQRQPGALTQTKQRLASTGPGPHERVLSVVRDRPLEGGAGDPTDSLASALGTPVAPLGDAVGSPLGLQQPQSLSGPGGVANPQALPFGGYNPGDKTTDQGVASPAAAVPEPATWAMMIVGFLAIGLSLRHGRRAAPRAGTGADDGI